MSKKLKQAVKNIVDYNAEYISFWDILSSSNEEEFFELGRQEGLEELTAKQFKKKLKNEFYSKQNKKIILKNYEKDMSKLVNVLTSCFVRGKRYKEPQ